MSILTHISTKITQKLQLIRQGNTKAIKPNELHARYKGVT